MGVSPGVCRNGRTSTTGAFSGGTAPNSVWGSASTASARKGKFCTLTPSQGMKKASLRPLNSRGCDLRRRGSKIGIVFTHRCFSPQPPPKGWKRHASLPLFHLRGCNLRRGCSNIGLDFSDYPPPLYLRVEKVRTESTGNCAMKARPGGFERWSCFSSTPFLPFRG